MIPSIPLGLAFDVKVLKNKKKSKISYIKKSNTN